MKSKTFLHIFFLVVLSTAVLLAQNKNNKKTIQPKADQPQAEIKKPLKKEAVIENNTGKLKTTAASGDSVSFRDSDGHTLMKINDEGTTGSITIPAGSAPSTTTNKLYNVGSMLYFNGSSLGSGSGVSAINDLSDAKYDGSSLFLGEGAGSSDDGNNYNTAVGKNALYSNTSGYYNTASGVDALLQNTAGNLNTANGSLTLYSNTTGGSNTANGYNALSSNTTGNSNTANGAGALFENKTGGSNTANGVGALSNNSSGSGGVAVGYESQFYANNTTTSFTNSNTSVGYQSLMGSTTPANNTGNYNSAFGHQALYSNTTGSDNTAIGFDALYDNNTGINNTVVGYEAGFASTGGSGNVFIGRLAGFNELGSNKLYISNSGTLSPLIWGDFTNGRVVIHGNAGNNTQNRTFFVVGEAGGFSAWYNDSDIRLKKNIKTISGALKKVNKLRGVNFEWKDPKQHGKGLQMGFIAQEAEKVIPEVVDTSGDHYTMQYAPVTALLVEAVKELSKQNDEIKEENEKLNCKYNELLSRMEKLEREINGEKIAGVNE